MSCISPERIGRAALFGAWLLSGASLCSQPQTVGQWSGVQAWPVVPVHAMLLPNGLVMFYPYDDDARVWDPADNSTRTLARAGYNIFCTGHSYLGDGRLLITGGHISNGHGLNDASIYDPFQNRWERLPDMNDGRWYPSSTTLANGDVLITSGARSGGQNNDLPQVWQTQPASWRHLDAATLALPLYPRQFLSPNGSVFVATHPSRYLNPDGRGTWTTLGPRLATGRDNYGSACLYDVGKVMFTGGGDPPLASAEVIDLRQPTPAWRAITPMKHARRQHNVTLLPDGTVLITGGSSGAGFDNLDSPVLATELWQPATESWHAMANSARYRGYHSIALLLPDGRVLSAGGDYELNAEIFSPPYLFKSTRPVISSAPTAVTYGANFQLATPDADGVTSVVCLRLGSVTHGFNMDQRMCRLDFTRKPQALETTAPGNPNVCPPGYYMLFILNQDNVPSVAKIIRISGHTAPPPSIDTAFVTGHSSGRLRNDYTGPVGMQFLTGPGAVTVMELGRLWVTGNAREHTLAIYTAADRQLLASTRISMTGGIAGQYKYSRLDAPVLLQPNTAYLLASEEQLGGDLWQDLDLRLQTTAIASCRGPAYRYGSSWQTFNQPNAAYGPLNFTYRTTTPVSHVISAAAQPPGAGSITGTGSYPEGVTVTLSATANTGYRFTRWLENNGNIVSTSPTYQFVAATSRALEASFELESVPPPTTDASPFVTAVTPARLRNDFTGPVGMQIRVGAKNLTVGALGRWVHAGNSRSHRVQLIAGDSGAEIAAGTVTPTPAVGVGFVYTLLTPPVTLTAGKVYYLVSHEQAGGDTWYDHNARVTCASPAVCLGPAYAIGSQWFTIAGANLGYGPVNFKFSDGAPEALTVVLSHPTNGSVFIAPANIPVVVNAAPAAAAASVRVTANQTLLHQAAQASSSFVWSNVAEGHWTVSASATDHAGNAATSGPATVIVRAANENISNIAHWAFDEPPGTAAVDASGRHHGTLVNGPFRVAGVKGQALQFDGSNDHVTIPDADPLDLAPPFTISLWFKPGRTLNASTGRMDLCKKFLSYWLISNYPTADGKLCFVVNSGIPFVKSVTSSWSSNLWWHVAVVCDGNTMKLYVNGVLENSVSTIVKPAAGSYPLQLGGNTEQGIFYTGALDEVRMEQIAVSAEQVRALYESAGE